MPSAFTTILSLLCGVALLTAANSLLGTVVSVRMAIERFPQPLAGLVMSTYFVGFVLGSIYHVRLIERVGHIRAFAACAATVALAATAQALVVAPLPWMVLRGLVGLAIAGKLMVAESWLNATATRANRGRIFSLYMIVIYLSFGSGQFLFALGHPAGPELFLVVTLLLSGSILPIVLTRARAPVVPPTPRLQFARLYETAPLGLAGALAAGIAVGSIQSIGPLFASAIDLSVTRISQFMGVLFLSGLLLQWPVGRLSDAVDRRWVLAAMSLATGLACLAVAVSPAAPFGLLIGLAVLTGGTIATLYPLSVAHANDRLRQESVIAITATLLLAYGIGAIAGPVLATAVMVWLGAPGLFYTAAAPCAALALYTVYRIRAYAPVEQDRFEAVAQTTPAVLELDPRAPEEGLEPAAPVSRES